MWQTRHYSMWQTRHSPMCQIRHCAMWQTRHCPMWQTRHSPVWQTRHSPMCQIRHCPMWQTRHCAMWQTRHCSMWQTRHCAMWQTLSFAPSASSCSRAARGMTPTRTFPASPFLSLVPRTQLWDEALPSRLSFRHMSGDRNSALACRGFYLNWLRVRVLSVKLSLSFAERAVEIFERFRTAYSQRAFFLLFGDSPLLCPIKV